MNVLLAAIAAGSMAATPFTLSSPALHNGAMIDKQFIYHGYGCDGANVSPPLHWSGAPAKAESFAVTVWDPDAPLRGGWWHWVLFDIRASTDSLSAGAGSTSSSHAPPGSIEGTTSFRKPGYGGPCPPPGTGRHHYIFTVYALDVSHIAGANDATTGPELTALMAKHILGKTTLTGRYGKD
jgi:Raf kinase inhibitor-like YbhB/YbcL family protein